MKEIWKDIDGFNGWYQVSNLGRIKSFRVGGRYCKGLRSDGKIMNPAPDRDGYPIAHFVKDGKSKFIKVHRIVAKHFIPKGKGKNIVNHLNGIKDDNRVENLSWSTCAENQQHAVENGMKDKSTTLTKEDVVEMRELYFSGKKRMKDLVPMYPVTRTAISRAVHGVTWGWLD